MYILEIYLFIGIIYSFYKMTSVIKKLPIIKKVTTIKAYLFALLSVILSGLLLMFGWVVFIVLDLIDLIKKKEK